MPRTRTRARRGTVSNSTPRMREKTKQKKELEAKAKRKVTLITSTKLKKAIKGTHGIKKNICANLGVSYSALNRALARQGVEWDKARELLEAERERVGDMAEEAILDTMGQRLDLNVASSTARWYLDRKGKARGFGKTSEVTLQGGKSPIRIEHETLIPIEKLDLPLETKKEVLEAMRKYHEESTQK